MPRIRPRSSPSSSSAARVIARRPRHRQLKACPKTASPGLTLRQLLPPAPFFFLRCTKAHHCMQVTSYNALSLFHAFRHGHKRRGKRVTRKTAHMNFIPCEHGLGFDISACFIWISINPSIKIIRKNIILRWRDSNSQISPRYYIVDPMRLTLENLPKYMCFDTFPSLLGGCSAGYVSSKPFDCYEGLDALRFFVKEVLSCQLMFLPKRFDNFPPCLRDAQKV